MRGCCYYSGVRIAGRPRPLGAGRGRGPAFSAAFSKGQASVGLQWGLAVLFLAVSNQGVGVSFERSITTLRQ